MHQSPNAGTPVTSIADMQMGSGRDPSSLEPRVHLESASWQTPYLRAATGGAATRDGTSAHQHPGAAQAAASRTLPGRALLDPII